MPPVRLTPSPREKLWGKTRLMPWFPNAEKAIGEVWFLCDQNLPLLVKLLFTSERLSIQVHPDDGEDGSRGKTEMWHIVEAEPGAAIALGFREPLTRERLRESCSGEIESLLNWIPVLAGETYFTPARTVHAIGAGIVLWEIQQNSDVTYRLWDYGRPRELHIEQAAPISDLGVHPGAARSVTLSENRDELVRCKHFTTELVRLPANSRHTPMPEECQLWICLEGRGSIGGETFRPGEVWLLPRDSPQPAIRPAIAARFLRTYVPAAQRT
jgi:mannose-6-phosphate isomerase